MSGPEKGTVYRLVGQKVTLGRGTDNDISIAEDKKASRHHAKITLSAEGFVISKVSDRNTMVVNGEECERSPLVDGATFKIGVTEFRFNISSNLPSKKKAPLSVSSKPSSPKKRSRKGKGNQQKSPLFYIYVAIILGIFGFAILDEGGQAPTEEVDLRTDEKIQADVEAEKERREALQKEKEASGKGSVRYKMAQSHYVAGFRDYRQGQFERAIESFQACLSTFPKHILCNRYHRMAQKKFSELVQYHMILGRKYKDQGQFASCRASFRNVLTMIKDSNSAIYKEAHVNYKSCNDQVEDRF